MASASPAPALAAAPSRLSPRLVLMLAFACGATVANLYYAQPLLDTIAKSLGTTEATAGLLVTASQLGYAAGLLLIVPLGDLLERRGLITRLLLVCAAAMVLAAAAPSVAVLGLGIAVVGVTSVVAQVLVPFAGDLASDDERGRVVGTVMSGLLIGILAARTVSGLIAEVAGWRTVFAFGAALMVALTVALHHALPVVAPKVTTPYRSLLRSVATLVRHEPLLRLRMTYGALGMATFSVLWTSLTFLLSQEPYAYSDAVIGLFGIAGLAGASAALGGGRLFDRGWGSWATGGAWLAVVIGWVLCDLGGTSLIALIAGLVILDAGVQLQHIVNQSTIYALVPEARSRLTTAYMTGNFLAGALGSAAAAVVWSADGWEGVSLLGGGLAVAALLLWGVLQLRSPAADSASRPPSSAQRMTDAT
jgi:predicted MFS family arabinose efflux permease